MNFSLGFSILTLIWGIYHLATHNPGTAMLTWDVLLSGSIIVVSLITIGLHIYRHFKK